MSHRDLVHELPVFKEWVKNPSAQELGEELEAALMSDRGAFGLWYRTLLAVRKKAHSLGSTGFKPGDTRTAEQVGMESTYWGGYINAADRIVDDLHDLIDNLKRGHYPIFMHEGETDADGTEPTEDQGIADAR